MFISANNSGCSGTGFYSFLQTGALKNYKLDQVVSFAFSEKYW
jgi:hypothetical protein